VSNPGQHRPLFALLVDADNIPARYADSILKEISSFGEPGLRRVYGDWSDPKLGKWAEKVVALGLVAHQQSANTKGKNASDIGLVIDAMDILHAGHFEGFVLVSSDSDFTRLAGRIREQGLQVVGMGEIKTPESLRNACNRFIFVENISEDDVELQGETDPTKREKKEPPSKAVPIVISAMNAMNQEDEWYELGPLGQHLVSVNPDFDPRTYGSQKLSDLLRKTGQFEVSSEEGSAKARRTKS